MMEDLTKEIEKLEAEIDKDTKLGGLISTLSSEIKIFITKPISEKEIPSLIKVVENTINYLNDHNKNNYSRSIYNFQEKFFDPKDSHVSKFISKVISILGAFLGLLIGFCVAGPVGAGVGASIGAAPGLSLGVYEFFKEVTSPGKGIVDAMKAIESEVEKMVSKDKASENKGGHIIFTMSDK